MGYFANGTEGESYQARYCCNCLHDQSTCTIWYLHMMHNYAECEKPDSWLHELIPRSKDGCDNERCVMFIQKPEPKPTPRTATHCDRCGLPYHGGACPSGQHPSSDGAATR